MQTILSAESGFSVHHSDETLTAVAADAEMAVDLTVTDKQPNASTDVSSRFGARLRELRRERSLTQLRMATEFGIDRSFISDVERGRKSISLPMLEVIALGMKISLSELLQGI